ncbi:Anti-sigma regulatory factor (Ser/Thr protein kinase) [Geodermatophilus saharensis]|uniref:Anti-sigma regulatory factor (Ser/Thr protein kinase) n=1 Tax=Geodermatophilus saharensis TaxID=1137994 RepID=A0A238ZHS7_9ACTN|nr:ATP-binding protein [Geodermatophilus saharensis]SNR83016.1 Anti-sigma regulatory factor (Ser/Thr protein kinase) [Geodermatophilus saharensis]
MSTLTARVDLPPSARSVPVARHLAREVLLAWDAPQDGADVELLVTELVANVVDHVGGESVLSLELEYSDGWLRIAVADGSAVRPVVGELRGDQPRGRGMQIVEAIADDWGVESVDGGKRVWFSLRPGEG